MSFLLHHALAASACLLAALPGASVASSLRVDPIQLDLSEERRVATVTLRNEDDHPVTVRAYALGWTQRDGEDVYDEDRTLILSPPVFTVPPGGEQLVRVGARGEVAGQAFRVMIEEVPDTRRGSGIQVALRLNLPLFAHIDEGREGDLAWSASPSADGGWVVEASNRGTGWVRIDGAMIREATGLAETAGVGFHVVLPGKALRWSLPARPELDDPARWSRFTASADSHGSAQAPASR